MKTPKGLIPIMLVALFAVSCAGGSKVPFNTMIAEADSRVGESVTLGGYIINSQVAGDKTNITVMQAPLGRNTKPLSRDKSEGRFFVSYEGRFNPSDYSPEEGLTVSGKIAGIARETVEDCPSPCLKIESSKIRVWRKYEYYPPPSGGPSR